MSRRPIVEVLATWERIATFMEEQEEHKAAQFQEVELARVYSARRADGQRASRNAIRSCAVACVSAHT
jgi:hypothetical protein